MDKMSENISENESSKVSSFKVSSVLSSAGIIVVTGSFVSAGAEVVTGFVALGAEVTIGFGSVVLTVVTAGFFSVTLDLVSDGFLVTGLLSDLTVVTGLVSGSGTALTQGCRQSPIPHRHSSSRIIS